MYQLSSAACFKPGSIPIHIERYVHNEAVGLHSHEFYELVYMESGFSLHVAAGQTSILTPGDVFGIYPGCPHSYKNPFHAVIYNCLFTEDAIGDDIKYFRDFDCLRAIFNNKSGIGWNRLHLAPGVRSDVSRIILAMTEESNDKSMGWEAKLKGHLLELLAILGREFKEQDRNSNNVRYFPPSLLYKALSYIEENYHHQLRLENISSTVNLSSDYFSRVFRELIGLSPMEYLKIVRVARACELLSDSDLPISQIAEDTGFIDNSYFSRVFKQVVGDSPSHYRKLRTRANGG